MELTSGFKNLNLIDECIKYNATLYIEDYDKNKFMIVPRGMYYLKEKIHLFFEDPKEEKLSFIALEDIKKFEKHPLKFNLIFSKVEVSKFISKAYEVETSQKRIVIKLSKCPREKVLDPDLLYVE